MDVPSDLEQELDARGFSPALVELERHAQFLWRMTAEQIEEEIARFHHLAGRIPAIKGADCGALLLEACAEQAAGPRRILLLRHALFRAKWAADHFDFGTRQSDDYQRIERKLQQ